MILSNLPRFPFCSKKSPQTTRLGFRPLHSELSDAGHFGGALGLGHPGPPRLSSAFLLSLDLAATVRAFHDSTLAISMSFS
ncbi:MAG: hypothetical protein KGJ13_05790, partial [Patescibacteria group bacterium]|nr:hypothetical protein [Patescibacteria group bacterium]